MPSSIIFPKAAAEYVYTKRAFRNELWAFLLGWLIVFAGIVAASTMAIGFAGYLNSLLNVSIPMTAILLIGLLSLVNFIGIEESSRVNIFFTGIEILGLALVIYLGMSRPSHVNYLEAPTGFQGILAAALAFFAYLGFEDIVNIAEEMEDPRRAIPRALIFGRGHHNLLRPHSPLNGQLSGLEGVRGLRCPLSLCRLQGSW